MEKENGNENENKEKESKGVETYGGKYVQYNILGTHFELSSKYVPPIQPVGRGAYGIVWFVSLLFATSYLQFSYREKKDSNSCNFFSPNFNLNYQFVQR